MVHFAISRCLATSRSEENSLANRISSRSSHLSDGASNLAARNPSPASSPSMQRKNAMGTASRRVKSATNLNEKSNNNNLLVEHDLENRVRVTRKNLKLHWTLKYLKLHLDTSVLVNTFNLEYFHTLSYFTTLSALKMLYATHNIQV